MPWPDFSELSFGFAFLREFESAHPKGKFPGAPDFISQAVEATKGYDVKVLSNSTPVFFQFKRSFVLTTKSAREIQRGHFTKPPLYRMHLRERDSYRQHKALVKLEEDGNQVFYVTSQVKDFNSLSYCYSKKEILSKATALIAPSEIKLPNTTNKHHITFDANSKTFRLYSYDGLVRQRSTPNWNAAVSHLYENRRNSASNRAMLTKAGDMLLESTGRRVRDLALEFPDPIVRTAVLALTVLDAQLLFFK